VASDVLLVGRSAAPVCASGTAERGPKSRADGDTAVTAQKYGPGDTWPSHQMPYWNKALAEARVAGWTLTYIDAPHLFAAVSCPAGEHTFSVDKTARGGETKSKEAIKKIRRCQHGTGQGGSKVQQRKEECTRLLGVADQLIAQAMEGLASAEAQQDAQEDLERLDLLLQSATASIEEVLADQETALQTAIDVDDAPEPEVISATLDEATERVALSESVARTLQTGRPGLAKPFLMCASEARARISELRSRLAALRERIHRDLG
jgi:hypothetical protein